MCLYPPPPGASSPRRQSAPATSMHRPAPASRRPCVHFPWPGGWSSFAVKLPAERRLVHEHLLGIFDEAAHQRIVPQHLVAHFRQPDGGIQRLRAQAAEDALALVVSKQHRRMVSEKVVEFMRLQQLTQQLGAAL